MGKYGVVGKYTVKLAQALRAHLVQHSGIFGVIAAEMDIEMLCCGALQRVQGLCAVGVAHVFEQIQIGKLLPCGKVVMVAAHIVVEQRVGTGHLQAQHGAVPVAAPDDEAGVDEIIAGTGILGTLYQIAVSVVDHLVDVLGVLGVIIDLRDLVKIGVLVAVGVGVAEFHIIQRRDAGIIKPAGGLRLLRGFLRSFNIFSGGLAHSACGRFGRLGPLAVLCAACRRQQHRRRQ